LVFITNNSFVGFGSIDDSVALDIIYGGWTSDGPVEIEAIDENVEEYSDIIQE